jgi:hypothetical protein
MTTDQDIWTLLEQDAPTGCESVQDLYSWSLNYQAGQGPFTLFLDLIGYSEDEYGDTMWQGKPSSGLGYVELGKLAAALTSYANRPQDVTSYVGALMAAESAT